MLTTPLTAVPRSLRRPVRHLVALFCAALFGALPAARAVTLAAINELPPGNQVASSQFRNGYQMAIAEINAAGGILGEQVALQEFATDDTKEVIARITRQAVQARPYAILGPISSGIALTSLQAGRDSPIPRFTGAEGSSLFLEYSKSTFRSSMSQRMTIPRLAAFATQALQAKKVGIVWVDNLFGRDGRDLLLEAVRVKGGAVTLNLGVPPGTKEAGALAERIARSDIEALIVYTNEGEAPAILSALRQQGFALPIVGDAPLVASSVRETAGAAAEGVFGHLGMFPELQTPRIADFRERYRKRYGSAPDHNAMKGYNAVAVIKIASERIGSFDAAKFNVLMQNAAFDAEQHRQLLFSVAYFPYGEAAKDSYLVQVAGGRLTMIGTIPGNGQNVVLPSGEPVLMYAKEWKTRLLKGPAK